MSTTFDHATSSRASSERPVRTVIVRDPERWIIPTAVAATTSIVIGAVWDISWHMTVGRDTLWTLPHLLEQFGAAVAGSVCGAYVLWLTFRAPPALRSRTVKFWGFQGPLGAWVIIWGALAMIVSVPFDNWWHNAYGLDVEILSPPHTVLMGGVLGIQIGTLLFTLAAKNRARVAGAGGDSVEGAGVAAGGIAASGVAAGGVEAAGIEAAGSKAVASHTRAYTYATGVLMLMSSLAVYEIIGYPNSWHNSTFYRISGGLFPFILVGVARAAERKWAATVAASTYMGIMLCTMWILQLIPAQAKLAPIYNPVTHMVPLAFPLVLVAPAIVIDVLQQRAGLLNRWLLAGLFAIGFVAAMLVVHWPFANFMLSPAARNYVFGADQWPYMYKVLAWRHQFWRLDTDASGAWDALSFVRGLGIAAVLAFVSARIGIAWGDFTRRIMR
jgi:hypothetical protein